MTAPAVAFSDNSETDVFTPLVENDEPTVEMPTVESPPPARSGRIKLTTEEQAIRDAEAPYGRRADGTPRKKPGPPPTNDSGKIRAASSAKKSQPRASKPQKGGTDYRPGIAGMLQIPAAMLGALGTRDEAFALDGAAVAMHTPVIAEALNDLAQDNLAVAAALDKILAVGPYGAILGAVLPLVAQIAANHKALPDQVLTGMGAMPREAFKESLIAGYAQP